MFKQKINWKYIATLTLWISVGSVLIVLLVAASTERSSRVCRGVKIIIQSKEDIRYIQEQDVMEVITNSNPRGINGVFIHDIDLRRKEELLEKNLWIRNADLYFDHQDRLQVFIEQRVPVARVFSIDGQTCYIDEEGLRLPFSLHQIATVPVFTSFPVLEDGKTRADSLLQMRVRDMGVYMIRHPFWMAQIDQIDIKGNELILVPKIGKHEILFGEGVAIDQKFKRLSLFYRQVMKKTGWNFYKQLDLRFDKLLIGVRRDSLSLLQSFLVPKDTSRILSIEDSTVLFRKDTSYIPFGLEDDQPIVLTKPVVQRKDSIQRKDTTSTKRKKEKKAKAEEKKNEEKKNEETKKKKKKKPRALMPSAISTDSLHQL